MTTVCFTGADDTQGRTRAEIDRLCRAADLTPVKNVTRDLRFLVHRYTPGNTSKFRKAREYGIECMTYRAFYQQIQMRGALAGAENNHNRVFATPDRDGGRMGYDVDRGQSGDRNSARQDRIEPIEVNMIVNLDDAPLRDAPLKVSKTRLTKVYPEEENDVLSEGKRELDI